MLLRNVLIFHQAALGDFIVTWPLAMALGRLFPQSRIIYVTHGQKGKLAEKVLGVESADIESGWHGLFSEAAALPEPSAKLLAGAHSIFDLISQSNPIWSANIRRHAPQADLITLDPIAPIGFDGHAAGYLTQQLKSRPAMRTAVEQMLRAFAARGIVTARQAGGGIVIHPGSGSREKTWPLTNFIHLIERIRGKGLSVRAILGEVELERWPPADIHRLNSVADIRRPQNYLELLEEISSADLFLANDSGPGHLGGIIGLPTLSLFGPTDPTIWRPLGPRARILRAQPLAALSVDEVHKMTKSIIN